MIELCVFFGTKIRRKTDSRSRTQSWDVPPAPKRDSSANLVPLPLKLSNPMSALLACHCDLSDRLALLKGHQRKYVQAQSYLRPYALTRSCTSNVGVGCHHPAAVITPHIHYFGSPMTAKCRELPFPLFSICRRARSSYFESMRVGVDDTLWRLHALEGLDSSWGI